MFEIGGEWAGVTRAVPDSQSEANCSLYMGDIVERLSLRTPGAVCIRFKDVAAPCGLRIQVPCDVWPWIFK